MYLISKDKDHVKKLRELEEKRYNEVAEIVQKDINEYEKKYRLYKTVIDALDPVWSDMQEIIAGGDS